MSRSRALAAIRGEPTDRVPLIETAAHAGLMQEVTGRDPYVNTAEVFAEWILSMGFDASILGWLPTPRSRPGALDQDGNHVYAPWGVRDTPWLTKPIYRTADEILAFDPRTHDSSSLAQKIDGACRAWDEAERLFGDSCLYVPGHYQLVLHYIPFYCDWGLFMELLALEPERCRSVIDRCADYSREVFTALAATPAPLVIAHEDLCSARGPIYPPSLLRTEVFPRFASIWEPVKKAGKRVLAFGEGKIEEIAPDLLAAGADGVFADPNNDLDRLIDLVGPRGMIVGGGDTAVVTTRSIPEIQEHVRRTMAAARRLPGFLFCLTGETPQNVPTASLRAYYEACAHHGRRRAGV
jgi:hypothetical protein